MLVLRTTKFSMPAFQAARQTRAETTGFDDKSSSFTFLSTLAFDLALVHSQTLITRPAAFVHNSP